MAEQKSLFFVIIISIVLIAVTGVLANSSEKAATQDKKGKIIITSRSGATVTVSKAKLTTRPGSDGAVRNVSRRAMPSAADPEPTRLTLTFPTLVYPGEEIKGRLRFNDPDDFVFAIFITVFFPDGDVVTESLYDYRIDGGDIWKGSINFFVDIPESETPLPGKIVITASDEFLNVSEVTQTFVQFF